MLVVMVTGQVFSSFMVSFNVPSLVFSLGYTTIVVKFHGFCSFTVVSVAAAIAGYSCCC